MDYRTILIRIFISFILGGLIGWQRESFGKPAGVRTHALVCLGSTLVMLNGLYLASDYPHIDPTRVSAQVISGIGFLGAGTILKEGSSIIGLTTASSIWLVGAIGIAVGSGFYLGAIVTTIFSFLILRQADSKKDQG